MAAVDMRRRRTVWCWLTVAAVALTACRHGDEPPSSTYHVDDGSIAAVADPEEVVFDDVAHLPGTGLMQVVDLIGGGVHILGRRGTHALHGDGMTIADGD